MLLLEMTTQNIFRNNSCCQFSQFTTIDLLYFISELTLERCFLTPPAHLDEEKRTLFKITSHQCWGHTTVAHGLVAVMSNMKIFSHKMSGNRKQLQKSFGNYCKSDTRWSANQSQCLAPCIASNAFQSQLYIPYYVMFSLLLGIQINK